MTSCGVWIRDFGGFLGIHSVPAVFGIPFSILVIILIDNAINLIDGMDGLSATICMIAALLFALTFRILSSPVHAIAAAATLGVLIPFWYFNVLGTNEKKTKTFMGDTGSQTLGFLLGYLIITLTNLPCGQPSDVLLVIGFSTVALPVMDLLRVFGERLALGNSPFKPDARHIHHKLLRLGLNESYALATLAVLDIVIVAANVCLAGKWDIHLLLGADLVFWILLNAGLSLGLKRLAR